MTKPIEVTFSNMAHLALEFSNNLKNGGILIPEAVGFFDHQEVTVSLIHPVSNDHLTLAATVVWRNPSGAGIGVSFTGFDANVRSAIAAFVEANIPASAVNPVLEEEAPELELELLPDSQDVSAENADPAQKVLLRNLHERVRHLNVTEQTRMARSGNVNERRLLERIYGKSVWDALLQNSMLTLPEVAHIARMGTLPMPLVEQIVNNAAWLSSPIVRRALFSNPRLRRDLIVKMLIAMPVSELRLIPKQTGYLPAVREAAQKLLSRK